MIRPLPIFTAFFMTLWIIGGLGCRGPASPYTKNLTGGAETSNTRLTGSPPRQAPRAVYVADFALDAANVQSDQGVRGILPEALHQGVLGSVGGRLPHPLASGDPAQRAREIVDTMAQSLVDALTDRGISAQRIDARVAGLPAAGWLLQGMFTEVDEGNRIKRAVIGFGQGATRMEVQVGISDLASTQPRHAFMVFGTVKEPGKMPGAIVTMNPYVAAAKFVMEKNATERDIRNTATQIVAEVLKYENKIKEEAASHR